MRRCTIEGGTREVTCTYCGHLIEVAQEAPRSPAAWTKDGVLYLQYLLDKVARLIAIEASTGRTLWDVLIPHSMEGGAARPTS